jgi:integrase/recombinase XerD
VTRQATTSWPVRDRKQWEKGVEPGGLFDHGGAGACWSEASRYKTACGYGYWLSWLEAEKLLEANEDAADRVTRSRVAAYVAKLQSELSPCTVLCRIQELSDALRVIAPESDLKWLAQLYRSLRARVRPMRDKLLRVRPIDELAALGERLMDKAESTPKWSKRRRAVLFRDGLMIAILAYRPVREKNFAAMRLSRHLTKVGGRWQIFFDGAETKSHVPYQAVFPSALAPKLERYLDVHRQVLMRGERAGDTTRAPPINPELDAVWVSEVGTPLEMGALARRISDHTRQEFGRPISPHLFRDCAATSIAVDNPKHVGDASLVLGHAGHAMTERHYNHARSLQASRKHSAALTQHRG